MANRKRLKKSIKIVTGELFADCVALAHIGQGDSEKLQGLMVEVLALHSDFVARLSHVEKGEEKKFFKKLRDEFTQKVNDLSNRIVEA
ncbi:MAG: hypothetical protein EGQ96_03015 [Prevotella sp.]|jgi:hypothetical protein|uniref:hypothetical protein n=1 Tax=Alloprevotella sp. TaxID=1872471 RepID=UPI0015AE88AD|nr:hypothetical protein [Prevotella sp.]MBD9035960.1 hypothetical protein [Prevotella sp.]